MPCEDLREGQAARLARSLEPGAEHEIGAAVAQRRDHVRDHLRDVAAVAVDEDDEITFGPQRVDTRHQRAPVAPARFRDDAGASGSRTFCRPVPRQAIDDDHLVDALREDVGDHGADRVLFVDAGNDHRDARKKGGRLPHRLHRSPQLLQALAGVSDCRRARKAW